jgi:hypothetical protein
MTSRRGERAGKNQKEKTPGKKKRLETFHPSNGRKWK